ncbi:MAG: class II aldolase/adducin family protein [Pseudomonadota bacterium]
MFREFEDKLLAAGLTERSSPVMGFLDASLEWNRDDPVIPILEEVIQGLSINSILFSRPAEPYRTIISYLARTSGNMICPEDCETRTFLHDLPVCRSMDSREIATILKNRKGVILPDVGLITYGMVSLEQAYVTFSSICFACFVKFFSDYLGALRNRYVDELLKKTFEQVASMPDPHPSFSAALMKGPFDSEPMVLEAMDEAGRLTVENRLVDSYFGNISCRLGNTLYISQTGSSLDNLSGCIDPIPMDGSSCTGITASSELDAHLGIIRETGCNTILHGHPRFSVILSMDCDKAHCEQKGQCHIRCREERDVCGIPVVPGEVGTGVYGLCNTVPKAIKDHDGVLVYGHGLFTIGNEDFSKPFFNLFHIEKQCREEYFRRVADLLSRQSVGH